jgi:hypothetical protein
MIITLIFVFTGILALAFFVYFGKGHHSKANNLDELASRLRPVDVDAFRNLIDEAEDRYLRKHLPAAEFRTIHRERMLAAAEYVWCAAQNAAILIRLAEAARENSNPSVAETAERLLENAIRLRLYAFQAAPRLYLSALLPTIRINPELVADNYGSMTRQVVMLGCLKFPTHGMSAAL